jgi:hypothetical protein
MSTQYRLVVHCDGKATADCEGVVWLDVRHPRTAAAGAVLGDRGWLRVERPNGSTHDLCPACREALKRPPKRA